MNKHRIKVCDFIKSHKMHITVLILVVSILGAYLLYDSVVESSVQSNSKSVMLRGLVIGWGNSSSIKDIKASAFSDSHPLAQIKPDEARWGLILEIFAFIAQSAISLF